MERNGKQVLICDCEGTMPLDGKALAKALDGKELAVNHQLCRTQLDTFRKAGGDGTPLLVACTQEAPLFLETQGDADTAIGFVNIRERAGWSRQAAKATPKIAALLAEAALDIPPTRGVSMTSEGTLLVIGSDETAIDAARQLAGRLDVTVLLTEGAKVVPPRLMDVPVFTGTLDGATGHLGTFEVRVTGFAPAAPSSRGALDFEAMAQTGTSQCDLILDLRGGTPLFTAPEKRDGYFNPDPGNPALVQRALFDLADLVGEFEKPLYIAYDAGICAHSRNDITGCSNCLDICPTGAIVADGDHVAIDAYVCAGCGSCASVCPTGAATYALPAGDALFQRLRTVLGVYLDAGGKDPVILVHDTGFGDDMIDALARHGGGLPANVIPFTVNQVTQVGLDFLLAAAAYGAARVCLLVSPEKDDDATPLAAQAALAETILGGLGYADGRMILIDEADPDAVEARLYGLEPLPAMGRGDFLPMGNKRTVMGLALTRLHKNAPAPVETLALPAGAPFGTVDIDVAGCTLCLSCVGACPTGALKDNPDKPQLSFREESCIQCGLCKATCPENVIALAPRLNFAGAVRDHAVVKEEEPFQCVRCGKPFGAKSSIERMLDKLAGHSMFQGTDRLELIKMCDDCRILVQAEDPDQPLAGAPRPLTRTTEDYLREREELRQQAKKAMEGMETEKKTET
jgi:ferredoxin